ncbi:Protein transport protein SEC31 [Choanephora cucurbitarum]|uniref:Protein transport protein SEC31 n=1 Tax=Choanephora cucurbitarum TaxID=101091 RepID=A0A1C7NAA6_9FUNG|nr:Protein transport protein SEC31 [Choanephora cucurbitarum]
MYNSAAAIGSTRKTAFVGLYLFERLSQINKTAVFAWSPGQQVPPVIATGTAAGALDDSFSNASELELFKLDFTTSSNTTSVGKIATTSSLNGDDRFNKLVWGNASSSNPHGVIAGGLENGELVLYDPSKILDENERSSEEEAKIMSNATHTGQIRGLDFNKFQHNLLASAGSNNEVYIWDLTNPNTPYTPGPKSQKADDITTVGWNGQVQHILATSSSTGHTVVWDLRNRKEVMTLAAPSMTSGRRSISSVVWHPDVATQLVTASEDDANPVVTLWDLRHAHSPEKTLAGHTKGVLSLSWCRQDSDLLMSCGKDCKTLVWNPNSGELLGELASDTNWTFQSEWCPRNPDLLASASFDGKISVHSLQNTASEDDLKATPATMDNANDDPFSAAMNASAAAASAANAFSLRHPPKWLRCPVGASFGFGGKLVSFGNKAGQAAKQAAATLPPGQAAAPQTIARTVQMNAIVTDKEAVQRADELEAALQQQSVEQLVEERVQQAKEKDDKESWEVIKTLLAEDAREQLMNHLGFKKAEVMAAVAKATAEKAKPTEEAETPKQEEQIKEEQKKEEESTEEETVAENNSDSEPNKPDEPTVADNSASGLFGEDGGDDFFVQTSTSDPTTTTVEELDHQQQTEDDGGISAAAVSSAIKHDPLLLYGEGSSETDRLITQAVILGDFESAVKVCLSTDRLSDALLFAICGGGDLLARTQQEYFKRQSKSASYLRLLEHIIEDDLNAVVSSVALEEWTSAIVVLCTFAKSEDFRPLCEVLGARLEEGWSNSESEASREFRRHATLCYLAAGNLEKVARIWIAEQEEEVQEQGEEVKAAALQALIEKVTIFRKVIAFEDSALFETESKMSYEYPLSPLYDKYCEYAELLADQGKLTTALTYLSLTPVVYRKASFDKLSIVRDRVYQACPVAVASQFSQPTLPFESKDIAGNLETQAQPVHNYSQQPQAYQQQPQAYGGYSSYSSAPSYAPAQTTPAVSNSYHASAYTPAATNTASYTPMSNASTAVPPPPAATSAAPALTTSYAPPTATGPQTTTYQPTTSQQQATPNYGYNQPANTYNQPSYTNNSYNEYGNTGGYNVARPTIPVPPPPVGAAAPLPRSQQEPVSAPPKKAEGAWNDPPMSLAKKVKSPKPANNSNSSTPNKRITSPFPNQPAANAFVNAPIQQQQQQIPPPQGAFPPPPMNRGPPQGSSQGPPPAMHRGPPQGPPPPMSGPPRGGMAPPPQRAMGQTPPPPQMSGMAPPPMMQQPSMMAPPPQRNSPLPPPPMGAAAPSPLSAKRAPGPPPQGGFYQPQRMN